MKNFRKTLVVLAVLITAFPFCVSAAKHKFILSYLPLKGTLYVDITKEFAKRVEEATQKKVEIVLNDSLVGGSQMAQAVKENRIPMATLVTAYYSATTPQFGLVQLPGLVNNLEEFNKVFYGFWRDDMTRILAKKYKCHVLLWSLLSPQNLFSVKPIKTVKDFSGKKIRVHNIETATLVATFGAKPTPLPASEVLPGLQRGIIDGVFTTGAWGYGQAFYSVTKYVSSWPVSTIQPFPIVISEEAWQKLPEDLRIQLADVGKKLELDSFADYNQTVADYPNKWAEKGAQFHVASEAEVKILFASEKLKPVYESYIKRASRTGFDGRSYINRAARFVNKDLNF